MTSNPFVVTMALLMGISVIAKVVHLAGQYGDREVPRWADALDVMMNLAFIVWAVLIIK